MKVKILVSIAGLDFSFSAGQIVAVSKELGEDLVRAGHAEQVTERAISRKKNTTEKRVK